MRMQKKTNELLQKEVDDLKTRLDYLESTFEEAEE